MQKQKVDEIDGKRYYACLVKDALACCSSGIEFEPVEEKLENVYDLEDEIVVIGEFDTYTATDGNNYLTLKNAQVARK